MNEEGWEARMAQRAQDRAEALWRRRVDARYGLFSQWLQPDDNEEIIPEILAARCLGISYGDPGPRLPDDICRECWGDRHIWLGNAWGMEHREPGFNGCRHACHEGELWLASA